METPLPYHRLQHNGMKRLFVLLLSQMLPLHFSRDRSNMLPTHRELWRCGLPGQEGSEEAWASMGYLLQEAVFYKVSQHLCSLWGLVKGEILRLFPSFSTEPCVSFQFSHQQFSSPFLSLAAVTFSQHPFSFPPISWSLSSIVQTILLRRNTCSCCLAQGSAASPLYTEVNQGQALPVPLRWRRAGLHVAPAVLDLSVLSGLSTVGKTLWCGKSGMCGAPCLCGQALLTMPIRVSAGNSWTNNFKAKKKGKISCTSNDMSFLF